MGAGGAGVVAESRARPQLALRNKYVSLIKMARASKQLELDLRRERRGGRRKGAGRRRRADARPSVPHRTRPAHARDLPLHLTLRASVRGLRREAILTSIVAAVRGSVAARPDAFRVLQFSVQDDHVHLLVEASDAAALTAGARGLAVRISRGVNRRLGRRGRLWADRYHARELASPRAVRNALVYVLANHKKHRASAAAIDPCSSGAWFTGWKAELRTVYAFDDVRRWRGVPPPIAPPATWLASTGWLRRGRIAVDESPRDPA